MPRWEKLTIKERLDLHVDKTSSSKGCWLWTGAKVNNGYGRIKVSKIARLAHIVSYESYVGMVPKHLFCLHDCDIRSCINPDHLFLGTAKDNTQDMLEKGRGRYQAIKRKKP